MIRRCLPVVACLALAPVFAQEAPPAAPAPVVAEDRAAVLRGIGRVSLDIVLTDGVRAEDADLRSDLRDAIELELRRSGIQINDGQPAGSPVLRLTVKFDRGAGRYAARVILSVKDQVTVSRNNESLFAEIWAVERGASSALDTGLSREIRGRSRDMAAEFAAALRKANIGGR